jgi:hypothetical protein
MQAIHTADLGIQGQDLVTELDKQCRRPGKHDEDDKYLPWLTIVIRMPQLIQTSNFQTGD